MEKVKAKVMAWTLFPVGLSLFFVAMLLGVNTPGAEILLANLIKGVALLGLILVSIAVAAIYAYFKEA